jgi:flagellar motility protein MotE (MotC chaperone)
MMGSPQQLREWYGKPHRRMDRPLLSALCLSVTLLCSGSLGFGWGVGEAMASAEPAKAPAAKAAAPTDKATAPASTAKDKGKESGGDDKAVGIGDPAALLNDMEKRRVELEKRAKWLDLREADLKRLEEKLAKRVASLEALRNEIRANLEKEKVVDDANITRLAKILSGMKAKAAADGLKAMDRETAVLVLKVMKEKVAAKILSKMDNDQAVQLANELGIPMAEKKNN